MGLVHAAERRVMPDSYSERGFAQYIGAEGIETDYGERVRVYESSAARGPRVWLQTKGEAHIDEHDEIEEYSPGTMFQGEWIPPTRIVPGSLSAHLDVEQATRVRDALDEFIRTVPERWGE